jgi:leader peptidase (prepilin peptidase) / N-methyltransferase
MVWFILFFLGLAIGSFLNVVALRYDGERFLFSEKAIGGRSHCVQCGATLRWIELIPLVSFVIQGGRCRRCKTRLSIRYPLVELVSALIFVLVPWEIFRGATGGASMAAAFVIAFAAIWVIAFELLLVMALIDIQLGIIPDELNIMLAVLGVVAAVFGAMTVSGVAWQWGTFLNPFLAALGAGAFFGILIAVTRGKGMGMGDLKLAIPLGLLFGWPQILLVLIAAFVIGACAGLLSIARGRNTMKDTLPFGPFLAAAAVIAFFFGPAIITWYLLLLRAG